MLGWSDPESQHDVAEAIDFLHQRLIPRSHQGSWQGRRQSIDGGLERTPPTVSTQCIPLPSTVRHSSDVQHLVNEWYNQVYRQAFCDAGPWLFLQLPRFRYRSGRITKTRQQYHLARTLKVPFFVQDASMEVQWLPYQVVAIIRHHGTQPTSGHYTTLIADDGGFAIYDDDKAVRVADSDVCDKASRDMYVLMLARSAQTSLPAALSLQSDSVDIALQQGHAATELPMTAPHGASTLSSESAHVESIDAITTPVDLHNKGDTATAESANHPECGSSRESLQTARRGSATNAQGICRYFRKSG